MRTRLSLLVVTVGIAVVAVACGRATQEQIDAALGITPTATFSAEQIATGTANAVAAEQARASAQAALANASPGTGAEVSLAAAGDVTQGSLQYRLRCLNCHRAGAPANGGVLEGPNNPAVALTDQQLFDLVRTGQGHATPPGPLGAVTISDRQLINIIAYIRDKSK